MSSTTETSPQPVPAVLGAPPASAVASCPERSGVTIGGSLLNKYPGRPVALAVLAADQLTGQGLVAYLRGRPEVKLMSARRQHQAEVALIVVDRVTEETVGLMERVVQESVHERVRFVLVGDGVREQHMLRAVTCGLVSVIPRREADHDRILQAVVEMREGRLELPPVAIGWVVEHLRSIHQNVLEPNGLTPVGLEAREVDVLALLAQGLSTYEISLRMNYSERTIKNIIHGVVTRLNLRNRTQAVAYAVRIGAF